jgi:quercetin dioxygenase-like cupin family protein
MSSAGAEAATTGSFAELPREDPFPGVRRQALNTSRLTMARYTFAPGATFPIHSHHQEQVTVIEAGSVEMTIGGSVTRLEAGDWSLVEPDVEHGITAGGDGARVLAVVAPPRSSSDEYDVAEEPR